MDGLSVAANWAVRPVLVLQSRPAYLSCSPLLTSGDGRVAARAGGTCPSELLPGRVASSSPPCCIWGP